MKIKYISDATAAPKAIGPYSQATIANGFAFLSGQIPIDVATGKLVEGGIEAQTEQVMKNLSALLEHLSLHFSSVTSTTIYLTDLSNFQIVNGIYEKALQGARPARATIQVAGLPMGSLVEIQMTAVC